MTSEASPTGGVQLEIGGGTRMLRFTNGAISRLEDDCGLTLVDLMERLRRVSINAIRDAIWAGLLHEAKPPTRAEVLDMIDLKKVKDTARSVARAIGDLLGVEEKGPSQQGAGEQAVGEAKDENQGNV